MDINVMKTALSAVRSLRLEVGNLFTVISDGIKEEHGEDGREFLTEIQRMINAVHQRYRELDQAVNGGGMLPTMPTANLSLHNTSFLTQESSAERHALYGALVRSHKWIEKIHKYSGLGFAILSNNSLKKSHFLNPSLNKRKRPLTSTLIMQPNWDAVINGLERQFQDMSLHVYRTFATNVVLQVTLGRVLHAMIAFKGIMIEWVIIKGYNESCSSPADLMTDSRYNVFRRITDHAHAATLNFTFPNPELTVKSFMNWLNSYLTLFTATCKQCGKHSHDCYPPTWRDFRNFEPYHFECKP